MASKVGHVSHYSTSTEERHSASSQNAMSLCKPGNNINLCEGEMSVESAKGHSEAFWGSDPDYGLKKVRKEATGHLRRQLQLE